jgi:hypothetical protein
MSQTTAVCRGLCVFATAALGVIAASLAGAAPTDGWSQSSFSYDIHKPYDQSVSARFKITSGVSYLWVFSTDKPFQSSSTTLPRTEMRWKNSYTSGNKMFDSDLYVPSGTSSVCLMQVFGASQEGAASAIMIRMYSGTIKRYQSETIKTSAYNVWWNLKVAHDANGNMMRVWDNNSLKLTIADRGNATHYFKNGVYGQSGMSSRMESRWRNIKYWTK